LGCFSVFISKCYSGICNREFFSISQFASPQLLANTFIVLSASKGLGAMPGARAAWLTCGDAGVVQHLIKVQSAASANASSLAQVGLKGSLEAVMNRPEILHQVAAFYGARTSYIVSRLNRIGALFGICSVQQPIARPCDATFYVWADFGALRTDKAATDTDLVRALRDRYQVQLTPAQRCTTNALEVREVHEKLLDDDHVLHLSEEVWAEQARPQLLSTLAGESTGAGVVCQISRFFFFWFRSHFR
jgi:aspartate/methionine/tyrosine aminotransferase